MTQPICKEAAQFEKNIRARRKEAGFSQGIVYDGNHEPLVDLNTWNQVQELLRKQQHYLKGTIFCGECGSRLSHSRSRSGEIYDYFYFMCVGRHQKRTDCRLRSVGQDFVEWWIEQWYDRFRLSDALVDGLRSYILDELDAVGDEAKSQGKAQSSRRHVWSCSKRSCYKPTMPMPYRSNS